MKRIVCILLLICFFFGLNYEVQAKNSSKKKQKTKQKIEVVTKDKFLLVGDIYFPQTKTDKPLVVMLHSYAMSSSCFAPLARALREKGYNVLLMDLRGHSRSVYTEKLKYKSRYSFQNQDWQKLPSDAIDSINYVKNNFAGVNTENVVIIGADLGANAGIVAGTLMKTVPSKFILISPMYEFKGIKMPVTSGRLKESKIFILLSKSDKVLFDFNVNTKPLVKRYPIGGPGAQLIKVNPEAQNDIINFIINN